MPAAALPAHSPVRAYDPWFAATAVTVPGTKSHAEQVRRELQALLSGLAGAARVEALVRLEHLLHTARTDHIWALLRDAEGQPFDSWEAFCVSPVPHGLGLPVGVLAALLDERHDPAVQARLALQRLGGRRLQRQGVNVTRRAPRYGANGKFAGSLPAAVACATAAALLPVAPGRLKASNNTDYLLARMARDCPELVERLAQGEYPSVHAAAVAAGIIPRLVNCRPTPESFAFTALRYLSSDDRESLIGYLKHPETLPPPRRGQGRAPSLAVPAAAA